MSDFEVENALIIFVLVPLNLLWKMAVMEMIKGVTLILVAILSSSSVQKLSSLEYC